MRLIPQAARGAAFICALLGSACTGLFHSNAPPEQTYYLRAATAPATATATAAAAATGGATTGAADSSGSSDAGSAPVIRASVRVGHTVVDPGLDSSHITLVQPDHQMNFYTGARWPAALPEVIETLTVETLSASGAWAAVVDSTSPFPADYLLHVAVRRFDADYTGGGAAPVVHVTFDCIIGRHEGREVIETFIASASTPATANRLGEVVSAFQQASSTALGSLSEQAAQAVRADISHGAHVGHKPAAAGGH